MQMNKRGFTLVELMVVLAILGLLAGIGIPQYVKTLERARVSADNAAVNAVQSAVNGYIAEVGGWPVTTASTVISAQSGTGSVRILLQDTIKRMGVLGSEVKLEEFWTDTNLPALKSYDIVNSGTVEQWYVSKEGKVYVGTLTVSKFPTSVTP